MIKIEFESSTQDKGLLEMLLQFHEEWNLAINSRVPASTKYDNKGKILLETSTFTFRGVEIEVISKLGTDNKYYAEIYVPSTDKFITNTTYPKRSRCAAEILMAITPGTHFEQTRRAREERVRMRLTSNIVESRKRILSTTSFPLEYQEWLLVQLGEQMRAGRMSWDDMFMNIIEKHHADFTLTISESGGREDLFRDWCRNPQQRLLGLNCLYGDIVTTLSTTRPDKYGNSVIPRGFVDRFIFKDTANWSKPRAHARQTLQSLLEASPSTCKFIHYLQYLVVYYQITTGVSQEAKLAEEKARKNYAISSRLRGRPSKKGYSLFDGTRIVTTTTPMSTIGDACPALDNFVAEKKEVVKKKPVVKKAPVPVVEETPEEPVVDVKPKATKKKVVKKKTDGDDDLPKPKKVKATRSKKIAAAVIPDDLAETMLNNTL